MKAKNITCLREVIIEPKHGVYHRLRPLYFWAIIFFAMFYSVSSTIREKKKEQQQHAARKTLYIYDFF